MNGFVCTYRRMVGYIHLKIYTCMCVFTDGLKIHDLWMMNGWVDGWND